MYVCIYDSFCLEKSTFKMIDFYFSLLTHLQPNSSLYLCINHHLHTSTYLTITYYFTYLRTYLPTKPILSKPRMNISHLGETLDYCSYNNSMSKV
jgi:hypothetical protein